MCFDVLHFCHNFILRSKCLLQNSLNDFLAACPAAVLLGALVHHGLVSGITLGIALRYILEALRLGPASKMFRFATTALRGCRENLPTWPDYCLHMQQVGARASTGGRGGGQGRGATGWAGLTDIPVRNVEEGLGFSGWMLWRGGGGAGHPRSLHEERGPRQT